MYFIDRKDAGQRLARALTQYRDVDAVIYALPRGGVPVGISIAKELGLPFDLAIASRIGNPMSVEHAVGAVSGDGVVLYNEQEKNALNAVWLNWAVLFAERDIQRKNLLYRGHRRHYSAKGKIAIVVDDGMATGITMRAVLRSIRKENPKKIVVAVPVASHGALEALKMRADNVVVLDDVGSSISAVSTHYADFRQLSDRDVMRMVKKYDAATNEA